MKIVLALAAAGLLGSAAGAVDHVTNGGFESSSYSHNTQFGATYGGQGVTGWTGAGGNQLEFYFIGGTQATTNATNQFGDPQGYFRSNFTTLSPHSGGNFVGLDGDSDYRGSLSQVITGLTIGKSYTLSFDWAASQLRNRTGATTEQFHVTFGGDTFDTSVVAVPSEGFEGWFSEKTTFTATATSQLLSFLSVGTPQGLPPIAVLDSVSLTDTVPEPATWALMVAGFGLVGLTVRRRNRNVVAA